ncbi:MAG: sensor histidine kinase [Reyranella sp.]|uniref:sensor histidine kinase n=1 Tax=Reyranella sp. TaxID=1929291 RepID=UPI001ACC204D|nr:sensor histidine kinase [Reyranella sp.]MBN9088962.1 sensor histidine kinase [Reyranella sp.]
MPHWSLRTKLVMVAVLALLPVLFLSGWRAWHDSRQTQVRRADAASAVAEGAASRHRELVEGSRRLLIAACTDDAVRAALESAATAADVERCEGYLAQLLQRFPSDYSALVGIDDKGVARCASSPSARGMNFSDREVFKTARQSHNFTIGSYIASRITPRTVVPMALPIMLDGQFHGMCALGLSLRSMAEQLASPQSAGSAGVALVDRDGAPLGGDPRATAALPVPSRLSAAIAARQFTFADYGQNGATYDFAVRPLAGGTLFVIGAIPADRSLGMLLADWWEFALIAVASAVLLAALWLGADRWCVQPLRRIQEFAGRVARGEAGALEAPPGWAPEMTSVGARVSEMAAAIASREQELKAGLEQRDHMLREIHHRVKNNLQMISSLLNLQAGEIRSPRIRRFFGDAQNRVLTLSILHRHLYERSSWSLVDFQQFISDLVRQISVARPGIERPQPRYTIRAPIMAVGPDLAIPVGLIVTEAVGRALNHDFTGVAVPEIRIEAHEKGEEVELVIEDNGFEPPGPAPVGAGPGGTRGSFGLTLIRGLAMQLGGEVAIGERPAGGTRVVVTFPMPRDETEGGADG